MRGAAFEGDGLSAADGEFVVAGGGECVDALALLAGVIAGEGVIQW